MKVLLKIVKDGKTSGYRPVEFEWMFTSNERMEVALKNVVDIKDYTSGQDGINFVSLDIRNGDRYISDIARVIMLKGHVIYLINPDTGKTIDIIRHEDI